MRLRTRVFLLYFLPFAILPAGRFWMIQSFVQSTVREGLRSSLREGQLVIARMQARSNLENSRFLKVAGENSALKAGIQLLLANPHSIDAPSTVEDQLRERGEHMGFDFMLVSAPDGSPGERIRSRQPPDSAPTASSSLHPSTNPPPGNSSHSRPPICSRRNIREKSATNVFIREHFTGLPVSNRREGAARQKDPVGTLCERCISRQYVEFVGIKPRRPFAPALLPPWM